MKIVNEIENCGAALVLSVDLFCKEKLLKYENFSRSGLVGFKRFSNKKAFFAISRVFLLKN